jgi:hypothetical protein
LGWEALCVRKVHGVRSEARESDRQTAQHTHTDTTQTHRHTHPGHEFRCAAKAMHDPGEVRRHGAFLPHYLIGRHARAAPGVTRDMLAEYRKQRRDRPLAQAARCRAWHPARLALQQLRQSTCRPRGLSTSGPVCSAIACCTRVA